MSLNQLLLMQLRKSGIPEPEQDYRVHAKRPHSLSYAWPAHMIALELEGMTEAVHAAEAAGWVVVVVKPRDIRDGGAVRALTAAFGVQ